MTMGLFWSYVVAGLLAQLVFWGCWLAQGWPFWASGLLAFAVFEASYQLASLVLRWRAAVRDERPWMAP